MRLIAAALFTCLATPSAHANVQQWQPVASIEAAARDHVQSRGIKLGTTQRVEAGPLDTRIRLVRCAQELIAGFAPGVNVPPRMTVEVRCPGAGGWKVYVPVKVIASDKAVVATRALGKGHLLEAGDVQIIESDVAGLPSGYAREVAQVEGTRLSRPVAAGTVLGPAVLQIEPVVKRGEQVTVIAQGGGIAVRSQARALADGGANQRIRLKSLSSGREIEGVVRGQALVEIAVN